MVVMGDVMDFANDVQIEMIEMRKCLRTMHQYERPGSATIKTKIAYLTKTIKMCESILQEACSMGFMQSFHKNFLKNFKHHMKEGNFVITYNPKDQDLHEMSSQYFQYYLCILHKFAQYFLPSQQ